MNIPSSIRLNVILFVLWILIAGAYTIYVVQVDNGLYAQIAIPFFFFLIYSILSYTILKYVFSKNTTEINRAKKMVTLGMILIPAIIIVILIRSLSL